MKNTHYLFYSDSIWEGSAELDEGETHHVRASLRLGRGDEITLTDGKGNLFGCEIEDFRGKKTELKILSKRHTIRPKPEINVYIGLPEKSSFEYALKALASVGVSALLPVVCRFSQRRRWWDKYWTKHQKRFMNAIKSASKQALNPYFMQLNEPVKLAETDFDITGGPVFYADINGGSLGDIEIKRDGYCCGVNCFVGPPGGFAPDELKLLERSGGIALRLANYRLRTELAAVIMSGCMVNKFQL